MPAEEMPAEEMPAEEMPAEEMPAEEMPAEEIPAEGISMEEPRMEEIPIAKPRIEEMLVEQPPIEEMPVEQQPLEEPYVKEQPVEEPPVEEPPEEEQSRSEPRARPATEPFPEAISPDRRFSYPRVTTSPQAPTPSPPTPIENTFGLKAPYLSPKAPTMSPPTPIERSMSSSPDIPLADQHFRLPPQIDAAQEADQAPAPDILHVPSANRMSVEVAPNVDTRVNAQLPVDHNLLEGMAEPRVAEESEGSTQHFTDGEEDLLGSLERSLGKQGGRL